MKNTASPPTAPADQSAETADERLVGTDVRRKFCRELLAERPSEGVGKHVRQGRNDKDERDRRVRIEGKVIADGHDDEEHRWIEVRDERISHRFQAHALVPVDEDAEDDRDAEDEHDERGMRRIVAPHRLQRILRKPDAEIVGEDDVRDDIDKHAELRKDHGDDLLRLVQLITKRADHFKRPADREDHDERIKHEFVHEYLAHKKCEQNERICRTRDDPELRVPRAAPFSPARTPQRATVVFLP